MKVSILGEFHWNMKLDAVKYQYEEALLFFLKEEHYGDTVKEIAIILVCRPRGMNLKQRHRFDRKNGIFYIDIMLDYDLMVSTDNTTRDIHFYNSFRQMLPLLEKKKIKDFNLPEFKEDFEALLSEYV